MSTTITFSRPKALAFFLRRIAILVDGKKSGKIGPNKRISISVEQGHHVIQARLDYVIRSPPIHINATGGEMEIVVRLPEFLFRFLERTESYKARGHSSFLTLRLAQIERIAADPAYSTRVQQRHRPRTTSTSRQRPMTCPNDRQRPRCREFASRGP